MKITKNWFYIVENDNCEEINIWANLIVWVLLLDTKNSLKINIAENSKAEIFGFFSESCSENLEIIQGNYKSEITFKALFIDNKINLNSNIVNQISGNNSHSKIKIISIVKNKKISVDSCIKIPNNSKNIDAKLELENIFIWDNWSINSNPNLFIDSNDVKVSHSSKTHRIPEEKLFYLKSRWLDEKNSSQMLLESYFRETFSCVEMFDKNYFDKLKSTFLSLI